MSYQAFKKQEEILQTIVSELANAHDLMATDPDEFLGSLQTKYSQVEKTFLDTKVFFLSFVSFNNFQRQNQTGEQSKLQEIQNVNTEKQSKEEIKRLKKKTKQDNQTKYNDYMRQIENVAREQSELEDITSKMQQFVSNY